MDNESYSIVQYGHKHGTDAWITRRGNATRSILHVILESIGDAGGSQPAILEAIIAGKDQKAIELWADATDEYFDVRNVELPTESDPNPADLAREVLASLSEGE